MLELEPAARAHPPAQQGGGLFFLLDAVTDPWFDTDMTDTNIARTNAEIAAAIRAELDSLPELPLCNRCGSTGTIGHSFYRADPICGCGWLPDGPLRREAIRRAELRSDLLTAERRDRSDARRRAR